MDHTHQFLVTFLRDKPQDMLFYVWTLQDKTSRYFKDLAQAEQYISELSDNDVYISMALSSKSTAPSNRTLAKDTAGIMGLWLDIDYGETGHKKGNIPPNLEAAMALIDDLPPPTLIVNSGGGLHVYWLFNEAWIFGGDNPSDTLAERDFAAETLEQWNDTLVYYAAIAGYDADRTFDLARVLRIPGTFNHKTDPARPCELLSNDGPRYDLDELFPYFKKVAAPAKKKRATSVTKSGAQDTGGALVMSESAEIPASKLDALMDRPNFKKTWTHKRVFKLPDGSIGDNSDSVYEAALASYAVAAGFTDQEACDLMIMWRRKHTLVPTLKNGAAYFARTIATARMLTDQDSGQHDTAPSADPATRRGEIIKALASVFNGVEILRVIKYDGAKPIYKIITGKHGIVLGEAVIAEVSGLITQTQFRNHMAAAANTYIPSLSKARWDNFAPLLLELMEVETIEEATTNGHVTAILREYLEDMPPAASDFDAMLIDRKPVIKDGRIYIQVAGFQGWLGSAYRSERNDHDYLCTLLKMYGAKPKVLSGKKDDGKTTTRYVWEIPPLPDVDYGMEQQTA